MSKTKLIDLDAINNELPEDDAGLILRGLDAVLERGSVAEAIANHGTFKIEMYSELRGVMTIERDWPENEDYLWTTLETSIHPRPKIDKTGGSRSLVIFWKPRKQLVALPYGCSVRETVDALSRWSVIERAKCHLIEHLCEQEADKNAAVAEVSVVSKDNDFPEDEELSYDSEFSEDESDFEEDCYEDEDSWKKRGMDGAAKAFFAKLKTRFASIQVANSVFPPDLSTDKRAEKLAKYGAILRKKLQKLKEQLREQLSKKLGMDERNKHMTIALQYHEHQVQEIRKKILAAEEDLDLLNSGKVCFQPYDSLFETLSDAELVSTFKKTVLSRGDWGLAPPESIEFQRVGPNEKNPHGCEYKLAYPMIVCMPEC